jgi:hypothetical protein
MGARRTHWSKVMALIKVIVQEQKTRYSKDPVDDETSYWETVHEVTSADPGVVAGSLRAIADKYSPPKVAYRGNID